MKPLFWNAHRLEKLAKFFSVLGFHGAPFAIFNTPILIGNFVLLPLLVRAPIGKTRPVNIFFQVVTICIHNNPSVADSSSSDGCPISPSIPPLVQAVRRPHARKCLFMFRRNCRTQKITGIYPIGHETDDIMSLHDEVFLLLSLKGLAKFRHSFDFAVPVIFLCKPCVNLNSIVPCDRFKITDYEVFIAFGRIERRCHTLPIKESARFKKPARRSTLLPIQNRVPRKISRLATFCSCG